MSKTTTTNQLDKRVKLQIDHRTIVIVKTKSALDLWTKRHPAAKVIAD